MTISKRIFTLALISILAITTFSIQTFAAGTETWYGNYVNEPTITVTTTTLRV